MGARAKRATFGTAVLWSSDSPSDLDGLQDRMQSFVSDRNAELLNLRERLYDQLGYPRELRGGWMHDPRLASVTETVSLSKADAGIAIRAICQVIELATELNRLRERDARAMRAYLETSESRRKAQAFIREMGIVSSTRTPAPYATDLYIRLTRGDPGITVVYEIPPGATEFSEARRRALPKPTPLSNLEAASVLADWFEVPYETVRTWLERERGRRASLGLGTDFKLPLSEERGASLD